LAGFALILFLPLLAYCIVQCVRDALRKNWIMAFWGAAMSAFLLWMVARLFANPGY